MARKAKGGKKAKQAKPDTTLQTMFMRRMYGGQQPPAGEQTAEEPDAKGKKSK